MDYKIYIGEEKTTYTDIEGVKITFVSKPLNTDTIALNTGTVVLTFASSTNSNEELASNFADVMDGFSLFNVEYTEGNDYVIVKNVDESPLTTIISGSFATQQPLVLKETIVDYNMIDLFDEESIKLGQKLNDIEKLSNVFTDYTNTFSAPATSVNNKNLKYYFDIDNDLNFNANIRVPAYIEFESEPFKFGKLQLESLKKVNGEPESYELTFYGNTVQLTDTFKDDTIDKLDYKKDRFGVEVKEFNSLSRYDFEYDGANLLSSIQIKNFKDGDIITPLISYGSRDWNYGSNDALDISVDAGAIKNNELRQAIRLYPIMEGIERKYGITFSRGFISKACFKNAFLWLNEVTEDVSTTIQDLKISNSFTGTNNGSITFDGNYISLKGRRFSNNSANIYQRRVRYVINPTNPTVKYDAFLVDANGNTLGSWKNLSGNRTLTKDFNSSYTFGVSLAEDIKKVKLVVLPKATLTFTCTVNASYKFISAGVLIATYADVSSSPNNNNMLIRIIIEDNIPKLKVIDFIQGLMKMFKLVIRPETENSFYFDTLNRYYKDGNILNISQYVDLKDIKVERPALYKEISFNYQKSDNVLGKKFRKAKDPIYDLIGYGDLKASYDSIESKETLKIEVPFENMLFERLEVLEPNTKAGETTNIMIGQALSSSDDITFSQNKCKPVIFFNNGIANNTRYPFKLNFNGLIIPVYYNVLIGNSNDEYLSQVTDSLNFGAEIDPWHLEEIPNSLYLNYWDDWLKTVYDIKQRKFSFEATLPKRFIKELSLNDILIIGQNRYKISTFEGDLKTKKVKTKLFSDIYEWTYYDFPQFPGFKSYSFEPKPKYLTHYSETNDGEYVYLYGNFTSYNGNPAGRILKLNKKGEVDPTFVTGTGFNNNTFAFQSLFVGGDNGLIATGNFTSYNGITANRIIKLNPNGSVDTSFVYGTGFNNITSGVSIDSNNKIYIGGSFTSYNGTSANRIIRLNPNGSRDTGFVYGTGFNNVVNSIAVNSDNTLFVTGYFTAYNGTSANKVIKLNSNGSVDTSFVTGTGFTAGFNSPIGVIRNSDDAVYFYGYFTAYNGVSANRIIRLNFDGSIDTSFEYGTGFNNIVSSVKILPNDRLLIQGAFTEYNGISTPNSCVILNRDGSLHRTFEENLIDFYNIGNLIYATNENGFNIFISDESFPPLSYSSIETNAGGKYYDIDILLKEDWSVEKFDLGFGTDWIEIVENGQTCTIRVLQKLLESEPQIYEARKLDLLFNIGSITYGVRIKQNGLEEI